MKTLFIIIFMIFFLFFLIYFLGVFFFLLSVYFDKKFLQKQFNTGAGREGDLIAEIHYNKKNIYFQPKLGTLLTSIIIFNIGVLITYNIFDITIPFITLICITISGIFILMGLFLPVIKRPLDYSINSMAEISSRVNYLAENKGICENNIDNIQERNVRLLHISPSSFGLDPELLPDIAKEFDESIKVFEAALRRYSHIPESSFFKPLSIIKSNNSYMKQSVIPFLSNNFEKGSFFLKIIRGIQKLKKIAAYNEYRLVNIKMSSCDDTQWKLLESIIDELENKNILDSSTTIEEVVKMGVIQDMVNERLTNTNKDLVKCPKCGEKFNLSKNKVKIGDSHNVMSSLGLSQIQLKCPKCNSVMEYSGKLEF
ncbi:MAG: hypothetical protein KZQ83_10870 [gamma proteobacterium symbiont of Taylorina sp.]|nr:hypothetical protein [gamma proteobacterium symbiont of Taylorina sp.]